MSGNTREIKDVFYLVALQGISYVMPLVVFPYLMVVLGAEKFGYIGFSVAVTQYLMLIVDFGFNLTATKEIAIYKDNPAKLREVFWSVTVAKVLLLLVSFAVLLIVAYGIPQFRLYRSTLLTCFLMVVANTFSYVWFFQGLGKIRIISIINTLSKLCILPLCFVFVKAETDYLNAAFIQAGVYLSGTFFTILFLLLNKQIPKPKWLLPDKMQVLGELKSGTPVFLSGAASSLYVLLFAVVLGYFATPEEVGKYTAAEKIMRAFCYLILVPVLQAFFPKISAMSQQEPRAARLLVRKLSAGMLAVMLCVFVLLFFFSDGIMSFLGKDYDGISLIFKLMAIVPLFVGLGGVLGQLGLLAMGNESDKKHYQNVYLVAGAFALVAIFGLIPAFGSVGASIALLFTEFVVCCMMAWHVRNKLFYC